MWIWEFIGAVVGGQIGLVLQKRLAARPLVAIAVGVMQVLAGYELVIADDPLRGALSWCLSLSGALPLGVGLNAALRRWKKSHQDKAAQRRVPT